MKLVESTRSIDLLGGAGVARLENRRSRKGKSSGGKQLPPVLRMMAGRVAFIRAHDFGERGNPRHAFISAHSR